MQKGKRFLPLVVLVVVTGLLLVLWRGKTVTRNLPIIPENAVKLLVNIHRDQNCKSSKGYDYIYREDLNACVPCSETCGKTEKSSHDICQSKCQEYLTLNLVKEMLQVSETDTRSKDEAGNAKHEELMGRIKGLETISSKFNAVEYLRGRMEKISKILAENEVKLKRKITVVEREQGSMINELQDAMDYVEAVGKMFLIGLASGCAFIFIALLLLLCCDPFVSRASGGSKTKSV